ncbi:MAG: CRTAC1 family protein [Anaerolineae bacterium]
MQLAVSLKSVTILGVALLLSLSACSRLARLDATTAPGATSTPPVTVPVRAASTPLDATEPCLDQFVAHSLDHTTTVHGDVVHLFESNGAGLAVNDLDGDGRLDIVLANLNGPATILWNEGSFNFRKELLDESNTRAVNIVDVDGDGRLDIVFTHRTSGVSYWHNDGAATNGSAQFTRRSLPNVFAPAYVMAWGDLRGQGTLDLVTGSYDAELSQVRANAFLFSHDGGVYYYRHDGDSFAPQRLTDHAQALAIALPDLDGNGRPDIVIGNDFEEPDAMWQRAGDVWQSIAPFRETTESTMSFDWADIDNSGRIALFAADMKAYEIDVRALAAWLPMMAGMHPHLPKNDPQIMENVLHVSDGAGRFSDEAQRRGVDATGWSWSSQFGDLDNDGHLDLYVVNGMIAKELFGYLPNNELVEVNQAFRNNGNGRFLPATQWGLGSTASGRGMVMADLNNDGQLDIVVNNLQSPAQIFENRLCGGASVEVDLAWPDSRNTRAIGAQVTLHTSAVDLARDVRSASGYLSGPPSRLHFGFPADAKLQSLDIRWPDGAISTLDQITPRTRLTVTR